MFVKRAKTCKHFAQRTLPYPKLQNYETTTTCVVYQQYFANDLFPRRFGGHPLVQHIRDTNHVCLRIRRTVCLTLAGCRLIFVNSWIVNDNRLIDKVLCSEKHGKLPKIRTLDITGLYRKGALWGIICQFNGDLCYNINAVVLYTMARLETVGGGHTKKLSTITDVILALTEKIKIDRYAQ